MDAKLNKKVEISIAKRLADGNISPTLANDLAGIAAKIHAQGFEITDVMANGIIAPDGATLRTQLLPKDIGRIVELITGPRIGGIKIFPRGILAPDHFRVHIELK